MREIRDRIFLSTKTGDRERTRRGGPSRPRCERLRVDNVDLLQLHAVGDIEDLDRATGSGGALEAAMQARDEGLVGAVGITGHGHGAPATHLEALRRYPFDTVLTPWNYVLSTDEDTARDFEALVEEVGRQDAGLMIIKTISRRNWPEGDPTGDQRYTTWYEPFDEQRYVDAAVSFVLAREEVTSLAMVGDVSLVPLMIEAEKYRDVPRGGRGGALAGAGVLLAVYLDAILDSQDEGVFLQKVAFGKTGLEITPVGFGAWAIGGGGWRGAWGPQDDDEAVGAIRRAVELGINWVDTAAVYGLGHSEELVAEALKGVPERERPLVFTKCSRVGTRTAGSRASSSGTPSSGSARTACGGCRST